MFDSATLSSKYQISIPKAVRARQNWRVGQVFAFVPRDGGVMLVPVPDVADLKGIARGAIVEEVRDRTDRF